MRHQVNRVDVTEGTALDVARFEGFLFGFVDVVLERFHHLRGDFAADARPNVEDFVVAFVVRELTVVVQLLEFLNFLVAFFEDALLFRRRDKVVRGERQTALRAFLETEAHHFVEEVDRGAAALQFVAVANDGRELLRLRRDVIIRHSFVQNLVEDNASRRRFEELALAHRRIRFEVAPLRHADADFGVQRDFAERVGQEALVDRRERHSFALHTGLLDRQVVATHNDVLRRTDNRATVGRAENVVRRQHQGVRFDLRFERQREVNRHLVAVEVRVEAFADERVQFDGVPFDEHRLERLNPHTVERRRAVEQHRVVLDDFFQNIPNLDVLALKHFLRAFDRVGVALLAQAADDERLVQLQRDFLRKTALVQAHMRADDDNATSGVVDAFPEEVFAETALFPLNHIGQRFQRTVARTENRALATHVVEERVDRLLQHTFFVADNNVRRVQVDQLLQAVVAVDDAAVQVVEVARRERSGLEENQRAQVRRNDRDNVENHPSRIVFVLAVAERFDQLQAVDEFLFALFRVRFRQLGAQLLRQLDDVELFQKFANRFGAHLRLESVAVVFARGSVFLFVQELTDFKRRFARIDDDVILEINDFFQARRFHREQRRQAARGRFEEPNVDDRRGELDVAHTLAADAAVRDFNAATVARHALILHSAIFAAVAFPVLFRAENLFAEQTVAFRTVGAVVDRFGFFNFALRIFADFFRVREADFDGVEVVNSIVSFAVGVHRNLSVSN